MFIIIGSLALNSTLGFIRKPCDVDIITTRPAMDNFLNVADPSGRFRSPLSNGSYAIKLNGFDQMTELSPCKDIEDLLPYCVEYVPTGALRAVIYGITSNADIPAVYAANRDLQLALKLSHRYLKNSPHFHKTMCDIKLLRDSGAKLDPFLTNWMLERQKKTLDYSKPNLNRKKSEFFAEDEFFYVFDHDTIHAAIAVYERPAYLWFKPDGKDVWCDKTMFDALPEAIKLSAVLEESCVLALERVIIPFGFKNNARAAFLKALEKVCTSITSGWFREYAWEHFNEVVACYDNLAAANVNWYVDKFMAGVLTGKVRRI